MYFEYHFISSYTNKHFLSYTQTKTPSHTHPPTHKQTNTSSHTHTHIQIEEFQRFKSKMKSYDYVLCS